MKKHPLILGLFSLLLLFVVAGCSAQKKSAGGNQKIQIVSSLDFYGEVAQAVVGNRGTVKSLLNNPDVNPHDYEPSVADGKSVAAAQLLVMNGGGYDEWMNRLAKSGDEKQVVSAGDVMKLKDGENEHLWYNPKTMPAMADELAARLGQIDPDHKAEYKANAKKYRESLEPLNELIAELRAQSHDATVAVSEPVFDAALDALGYKIGNNHFSQAVEEGSDPSAADVRSLVQSIDKHEISFFVLNTQADSKVVDNVLPQLKKQNIPILNVTETKPKGLTYVQWMTKQYQALSKIQTKIYGGN